MAKILSAGASSSNRAQRRGRHRRSVPGCPGPAAPARSAKNRKPFVGSWSVSPGAPTASLIPDHMTAARSALQGDEVHLLTQSLLEVCGHGDCQSVLPVPPVRSVRVTRRAPLVERAGDLVELAGPADQISGGWAGSPWCPDCVVRGWALSRPGALMSKKVFARAGPSSGAIRGRAARSRLYASLWRPVPRWLPTDDDLSPVGCSRDPCGSMDVDADVAVPWRCGSPVCRSIRTRRCTPGPGVAGCCCASTQARRASRGGCEDDEETVALSAHLVPVVHRESGAQDSSLRRWRFAPARAQTFEQRRRPLDVAENKVSVPAGNSPTGGDTHRQRVYTGKDERIGKMSWNEPAARGVHQARLRRHPCSLPVLFAL